MTTLATVPSVLKDADDRMKKALDTLLKEFNTIRTGRASAALLEGVKVEAYGVQTPLKQLASISSPDPKMLVVQPWDQNLLQATSSGIIAAGLGVTPIIDKRVIRVPIPSLSAERREEFVKLGHKQAEASRVAVRNIRHTAKETVEKLFKDKAITEDEKFKALEDLDKVTHKTIGEVESLLKTKEAEIRAV